MLTNVIVKRTDDIIINVTKQMADEDHLGKRMLFPLEVYWSDIFKDRHVDIKSAVAFDGDDVCSVWIKDL
jgi:hypothetical protein